MTDRTKEFQKGRWFKVQTIDQLEQFYKSRMPEIRSAARDQGYAIGLHGSMRRDLDLIAAAWKENPCSKGSLAQSIQSAACGIAYDEIKPEMWEKKPCGRYAISLPICWTPHDGDFEGKLSMGHIDLSVIEALQPHPPQPDTVTTDATEYDCKICGCTVNFSKDGKPSIDFSMQGRTRK
jgi:hypothetical protein